MKNVESDTERNQAMAGVSWVDLRLQAALASGTLNASAFNELATVPAETIKALAVVVAAGGPVTVVGHGPRGVPAKAMVSPIAGDRQTNELLARWSRLQSVRITSG